MNLRHFLNECFLNLSIQIYNAPVNSQNPLFSLYFTSGDLLPSVALHMWFTDYANVWFPTHKCALHSAGMLFCFTPSCIYSSTWLSNVIRHFIATPQYCIFSKMFLLVTLGKEMIFSPHNFQVLDPGYELTRVLASWFFIFSPIGRGPLLNLWQEN